MGWASEKAVGRDPSAFAPRAQLKIPHLARSLAAVSLQRPGSALWAPAKPGQRIDGAFQKPSERCRCSARFHSLCVSRSLGWYLAFPFFIFHGVLLISVHVKL